MANDLGPGQDIAPAQNRGVAAAFHADLEAYTPNLMQALPAHVSVEKFKRTIITAVSMNPDLLYANRRTLFTAAVRCASDGLLPDGREAALVIYRTKMKRRDPNTGLDVEEYIDAVQFMPMIAGIRRRMRNTGDVLSADAHVVYEKDHFKYKLGDDGFIDHEPAGLADSPGKPLGAYAIIKLKSGEVLRDVMRVAEIEKTRSISRAPNGPMWKTFWEEGARKTVLRRCAKAAPQSAELESLLNRDEEEPPMLQPFEALPPAEPEPQRPREASEPEPDDRPVYTVVDLDGVEHEFREISNAMAALDAVFQEAAKQGLERLDGAWESNEGSQHPDSQDLRARMMGRFAELRDSLVEPPQAPPARESENPAPSPPPAEQAAPAPAEGTADAYAPVLGARVDKMVPPEPAAPPARPVVASQLGLGVPAPAAAPTPAEHASLNIPIVLRQNRPDWNTWVKALFLPKLRQAADSDTLAFLLGDNDENLAAAKLALGKAAADELDAAIAQRWQEVG